MHGIKPQNQSVHWPKNTIFEGHFLLTSSKQVNEFYDFGIFQRILF